MRVIVLAFVGDDEHGRIVYGPLNVLPGRAAPHAATLVISPEQYEINIIYSSECDGFSINCGIIHFFGMIIFIFG